MRLGPIVVLIAAAVLLTSCSDDPAASPSSSPASTPAVPASSGAPAAIPSAAAPASSGKPEIVTNPDGTINSGGPRPGVSDSALTAGGFGPYKIGVAQQDLQASKLVGKVSAANRTNCPGYFKGKGIDRYGSPALVFFKGRLLRLTVTGDVATDKGVEVGDSMTEVRRRYPDGKQIDDWTGRGAWLATVGDYGLLFDMHDNKVAGMQAGMTEPMQFKYTDNQGC